MTVKESVNATEQSECAAEGSFPTGYELSQEIGDGGTAALYTCVVLVLIVNLILFILLIIKFTKSLPHSQIPKTCWVTSLFTITSFVITLMVFLPKSTEFLMAAFRVYEAMVISRFVELNLMWWGGEKQLMNNLGDNKTLRYNLPPLCCCLLWLNNKLITRKRIKIFRFLAAQMIYVAAFVLFLQLVLVSTDIHDGHPSATNPHTYVKFFGRISFLFGFWSLFVFFKIEHTYKLLDGSKYLGKFTLMKFFFVLFLLQETIIELISTNGVISCSPFMSGKAKGFLIFSCIVLVQTLFFGVVQFLYYYRFPVTSLREKTQSHILNQVSTTNV